MAHIPFEPEELLKEAGKQQTGKTYKHDTELVKVLNPETGIVEVRKQPIEDVLPHDVDFGPLQQSIAKAKGETIPTPPNREERRRRQKIHDTLVRKMRKQEAQARMRAKAHANR